MTQTIAQEAMAPWGGSRDAPTLIVDRENAVYETWLKDGTHAALRLHRAGYRSPAAILGELRWTSALAALGFPCTRPIPAENGALLTRAPDGRSASVVAWIDAAGPVPPEVEAFRHFGALIARMHLKSDSSAIDTGPFPRWSAETLLGEVPVWGRFWENPTLTRDEARLLHTARTVIRGKLAEMSDPDIGLIHADLLPDNVLYRNGRLTIIDFDDSGVGYRGYDLGTALIAHAERPDYPELASALVAGYASRRGNPARMMAEVQMFVVLRALASCGWAISRTAPGDPRQRAYADRAIRLAERWMARA